MKDGDSLGEMNEHPSKEPLCLMMMMMMKKHARQSSANEPRISRRFWTTTYRRDRGDFSLECPTMEPNLSPNGQTVTVPSSFHVEHGVFQR
jgi:hypothetical protein